MAVGYNALREVTDGDNNVAIGSLAADALTSGGSNVVVGKSALSTATTATASVFIGVGAGEDIQAGQALSGAVAIGFEAFKGGGSTTTGTNNTIAIGQEALKSLTRE